MCRMGADMPPLGGKGIERLVDMGWQILLMVGGFHVDGGVELTLVDLNI